MRKAFLLLACLLLATAVLGACGKKGPTDSTTTTPPATTTTPPATTTTTDSAMYLITYHLSGGINAPGNPSQFRPVEGSVTLGAPTRDYYVFQGWYDNIMLAGTQVTSLTTAVQQDLQLYAKWEPVSYQIKYTLYMGGQLPEDAPRSYTVESGAITLPTPTREGYDFGGWYPDNKFKAGEELTAVPDGNTGEFSVFAKWLPKTYNIIYVLNDGAQHMFNPTTYQSGSAAITLYDPIRTGYTFLGWYTTERFAAGTSVSKVTTGSAKEVTLYARWMQDAGVLVEFPMITTQPTTIPENQPPASELNLSEDAVMIYDASGATKPALVTSPNAERFPMIRANEATNQKEIYMNNLPQDWTGYSYLTFSMYSVNATGAKIGVILYNKGASNSVYLRTDFKVNWTGWKTFRLSVSADFISANGATMTNVSHIRVTGFGWDYTTPENTFLVLADAYLTKEMPKYMLDPADLTSESFAQVKARWREMLIGNADLNATDSTAKARAQSAGSAAASLLATINTAPDTTALFDGLNYANVEQINLAYNRLQTMALGWATPGSSMYHNAELLNAIKFGLQWLYSYDLNTTDGYTGIYGDNVKHSMPGNWWNWCIGIPIPLTETLLLIEDGVNISFILQILEPVDYLLPVPTMTGSNRASRARSALLSAVLQQDKERTIKCLNGTLDVFGLVESGDGIYEDGSFIQHVASPYTGGYGVTYMDMVPRLLYLFDDTDFDYDGVIDLYVDKLFEQFFSAFEPLLIKGTMAIAVTGRGYSSRAQTGMIANLFQVVESASPALRARFFSVVKYYQENNTEFVGLRSHMTNDCLDVYDAYVADTTVVARSGYVMAHIFGAMDRVVQYTENYAVVLAISSNRIYRYESINGANGDGWYMGDGVTYVYGSNQGAYSEAALRNLDRLKLPGITVTTAPRTSQIFTVYTNPFNANPFTGGISDGLNAVAVMKVKYVKDTFFTNFSSDLLAHKAWFLFDDEIVCLGSNITATDFDEVLTVIDNRLISTSDAYKVNGEAYTLTNSAVVRENVDYITLERFGGYYFPDSPTLTMLDKKGLSNDHYLQLWVSHGQQPKAAQYLYVMLPEMSETEVAAYAATPDIQVLRNDNLISAVKETTLGKTGYAFWYAYSDSFYDGLKTASPCTVLKTENENGTLSFHVSDPSHRLREVVLTLDGVYDVVSADAEVSITNDGTVTTVRINTNRALGAGFTFTVADANP
ncbi:MAG: polysaccharide lyase family 8 super-sandwich domain-containing protein [Eubacteriales bacterium]